MLDPEDSKVSASQPASTQSPTTPVRRRRAASRPAGPPAPVAIVPPAVSPVAETLPDAESVPVVEPIPAAADVVAPSQSPELPLDSTAPDLVAETKPKRVRRPKAEPVSAAEETESASADTGVAAEPVKKTTRRRRTPAPAEQLPVQPVAAQPVSAEPTVSEPLAATTESAADDVASSLAELAKGAERTRARNAPSSEVFGIDGEADADAVLDSLAAAIGGLLTEADVSKAEPAFAADENGGEAEDGDAEPEAAEGSDADVDGDAPRRRRRRRGGRRRRRSSGEDAAGEADADSEAGSETETEAAGEAEAETSEDGHAEGTSSRRRRRRRRRGEDTGDVDDESVDVVVKVREPRRRGSGSDEVTGIEGSTRMEAKKQRRREGRAAGRRRTPILSESEFLARREAVDRKMLIRQTDDYSQIAVLEDGILVEHYVDRASAASMIGNIYLGKVQNVLPSMEAAFVDIGRGRNAVLYAGEVDWDSFGVSGADKKVEKVFKSGQTVLVQVSKDPVGAKGARLTSHLSIPGRYIVYSPGGHLSGISRKLPENERKRLKGILDELIEPDASVIVRTAAEGASEEELIHDVNRLKAQWEVLEKKSKTTTAPQMLYAEPDLTVRIVRDLFTEDFGSLIIDGNGGNEDAFDTVDGYLQYVAPHLAARIERWNREDKGDLFDNFRVHEQVAKALERKVFLPSGGSLIIDRTEAMTVIDVNTGKFTGTSGNLEATVTSNNLEAAEEIVRQLRLRDIGGIIVIDFIDMVLPANRELLLRRLVECLGRDRTRHQVAEVTSLGLVQMTRKKIGTGLAEAFTVACETCKGRGYHVHDAPVASQAPADGGDRDSGRRRNNAGGKGGSSAKRSGPKPEAKPAKPEAEPSGDATALSDKPGKAKGGKSGKSNGKSKAKPKAVASASELKAVEPAVELKAVEPAVELKAVEPAVELKAVEPAADPS
jgi:ribonuclease E